MRTSVARRLFQTRRTGFISGTFAAKWIPSLFLSNRFLFSASVPSISPPLFRNLSPELATKLARCCQTRDETNPLLSLLLSIRRSSPSCPSEDGRVGKSPVSHFKRCSAAEWIPPLSPSLFFLQQEQADLPAFLPLYFWIPALNKKKVQAFMFPPHAVLLFVVFYKTRRISGKMTQPFPGCVDGNQHPVGGRGGGAAGGRVIPSV